MGKLKVSFTTALFVFSFLICVIIAVVFVDRAPNNEYNSFYDKEAGDQKAASQDPGDSGWDPSVQTASPTQSPAPPPDAAQLTDLPIDPHLVNMAQPIPSTVTPTASPNHMSGKSPEEIARALMGKAGVNAQLEASNVPGMAVPQGIATPGTGAAPATATSTPNRTPRTYLPVQSNAQGRGASSPTGMGGPELYQTPSLTGSNPSGVGGLTNSSDWNPVSEQSPNSNLIGVHKVPGDNSSGMMIGEGRIEKGAQVPAGVSTTPVNDGSMSIPSLQGNPGSSLPGSANKPLLFPPGSAGEALPPAPTLRPPPIQDPDQSRSDANETPGNLNPGESSDQALAVSEIPGGESADDDEPLQAAVAMEPAPNVAAQVNNHVLTNEAALRLAHVSAALNDESLDKSKEDEAAKDSAEAWKKITAAAEEARMNGLEVGAPDVELYAAMRPDFDPAEWQLAMEDEGFSAEEIRMNLQNIALSEKLIETEFDSKTEDDEIRKAYDKSPSKYAKPRMIHLQEIYKAKPKDEDRTKKVEREMRRLQRQAASGTDFGLLARQASEAVTAKRGGNLGWINPLKDKDSDRDKALEDLAEGEVTSVIDEEDGFRIYRLVEVREAAKDFESAKDVVVAELKKPVRKDCYAEALKKLDAGELQPSEGSVELSNTAVAAVSKPTRQVVPTRVGSSLVGIDQSQESAGTKAEEELKKALAEVNKKAEEAKEATEKSVAEEASGDPEMDEETRRKFVAQELLGAANAQRQAMENPQSMTSNQTMGAAPGATVMHQPGQQTQLLFAPGSQSQQVANGQAQAMPSPMMNGQGGQPQPPYQAGGQLASPFQAQMQAPNQASFNHMGATSMEPDEAAIRAAQMARAHQAMQAQQAQGVSSRQSNQNPNQTRSQSNGWDVVKTTGDTNTPDQPPRGQSPDIPPGFGSGEGSNQQPERRGIMGNVKSFFSSIGR